MDTVTVFMQLWCLTLNIFSVLVLKSSSFVRDKIKLEKPKNTQTAVQRVRQYIDGVLIGVGRPEEICTELER